MKDKGKISRGENISVKPDDSSNSEKSGTIWYYILKLIYNVESRIHYIFIYSFSRSDF